MGVYSSKSWNGQRLQRPQGDTKRTCARWPVHKESSCRGRQMLTTKDFEKRCAITSKLLLRRKKGRLACFQFSTSTGAPEHGNPLPGDAEQVITNVDVADLQSLRRFTRRRADMPSLLKEAIMRVTGGSTLNRPAVWGIATSLGMSTQKNIQYPGTVKA